jgi:PTS system ascorbate-specific IIC component
MIASVLTLIVTSSLGIFRYALIPVVVTCFFECGTAAVVGNSVGGRRGAVISSAVSGVMMIFLMGFSLYFVDRTVALWMMGSGGQDFSVLAILEGLVLKLFVR